MKILFIKSLTGNLKIIKTNTLNSFKKYGIVAGNNITIGNKITIGARTVIGNKVNIGDNVVLGKNCTIGDDVTIGENCQIGDGSTIDGGSIIGDDSVIGACCTIRANCNIGLECKIGSGVMLRKNCIIKSVVSIGSFFKHELIAATNLSLYFKRTAGSAFAQQLTKFRRELLIPGKDYKQLGSGQFLYFKSAVFKIKQYIKTKKLKVI